MNNQVIAGSLARRDFLRKTGQGLAAAAFGRCMTGFSQLAGDRPSRVDGIKVVNPRNRVPVSIIIDDSTCLVNLNRFAMPQFDFAHAGGNSSFKKPWKDWPAEIPDSFVRKFAAWSAETGVKGKYSVVPYPACVGRVDRELPGWSRQELTESLEMVRRSIMPNWDIHPEMVTHTRVIDLKTGHPYQEYDLKFMENWEWTTGKTVSELADYMAYALNMLKAAGLDCEGITTPGGFGNRVLPELAQASFQSLRSVFSAEIPHYFRHLYDEGSQSVAPRVEYARGLDTSDPQCVVSIIGCTGDWTGGWDCSTPEGADRFITRDLSKGRMVDVIQRNEPAIMVCHWTGIYWNGQETGFKIFQEVVQRLHHRFENLVWMKLSEISRYWAAKELTSITPGNSGFGIQAPFACPNFTVSCPGRGGSPTLVTNSETKTFREVQSAAQLSPGTWTKTGTSEVLVCFDLPKGASKLNFSA